uniref:C2H2-type domain-containing protein n=1 Tax=Globodera pallida TaxID=36090 RepID=A0A183CCW7_GLOPA
MYTNNDGKNLAGLAWDDFFRVVDHQQTTNFAKQSSLLTLSKCNDDVAMLPHKKATCYGSCSVTEAPKLVKCQSCNLVVKIVAFGHHQKIHHNHFCSPTRRSISSDSDSDDDCQGFLLSPPHHPTPNVFSSSETMLDLKIIEDTKWTLSDSLKNHPVNDERKVRNEKNKKVSRQSPPRYDVQQRNDLRLVLTKRRNSIAKTRSHKDAVDQNQSAPLVSISITRSSGQKRNFFKITKRNSTSRQTPVEANEVNGCAANCLNAKEKCGKNVEWSNVQLSEDIFTADLEESEQSSIPLHHSPSESSNSDLEGNEQDNEIGNELFESYPGSLRSFAREQCPIVPSVANAVGWDPRKAAERPSAVNKTNNMTLLHKMQQKLEVGLQQSESCNDGALERVLEQSFALKRAAGKERDRPTERSPENSGMNVVVEKLFKIQGISVTALSPDGKRKLAVSTKQNQTPPYTEKEEIVGVGTDQLNHRFRIENGSTFQKVPLSVAQHQQETSKAYFQLSNSSPPVASFSSSNASVADKSSPTAKSGDLNVLNATGIEGGNELQKSGGNSPVDPFFAKLQTAQRKASASFAGVSWRKLNSIPVAQMNGSEQVELWRNSGKETPTHSRNGWKGHCRSPNRLPPPLKCLRKLMDIDSKRRQSPEIVCYAQQSVQRKSGGSPASSAVFLDQNVIRKRSFPHQQQPMQQQTIVAKRFRPIAPRKVQSKICAGGPSQQQQQQQNLHCRISNTLHVAHQQITPNSLGALSVSKRLQPDNFDQRFQPKIFSVFPSSSSVRPCGNVPHVHVDQLSSTEDFRTFGRQSRQIFAVKHQQSHAIRQFRTQSSSFDDDSRASKFYDHQIVGGQCSADFRAQRMSPDYSHSQMGKTTAAPCVHLHQCQPYGQTDIASSAAQYSAQSLYRHSHDPSYCSPGGG